MKRSRAPDRFVQPKKRFKESQDLSQLWYTVSQYTLKIYQLVKEREDIINTIQNIKNFVAVPEDKDWILYTCTWYKFIQSYHQTNAKTQKIQHFHKLLPQTPQTINSLYDILVQYVKQINNINTAYVTTLHELDHVYTFLRKS